jgi:hypothetical protein
MPAAVLIQPWDVDAMWETVAPHLGKALARQDEFRAEDIRQMCCNNVMQLWYVPETHALVTQIQDKPLCRSLMIVLCGGEGLEQATAVTGVLEDYGRAMQCSEVRIQGRRGWGRVLGYEPMETIMRKKL